MRFDFKLAYLILFLIGINIQSQAQSISDDIDSISKYMLKSNIHEDKSFYAFNTLIVSRITDNVYARIDSIESDYILLIEIINLVDSSISRTDEYYEIEDENMIFGYDQNVECKIDLFQHDFPDKKTLKKTDKWLFNLKYDKIKEFKPYQELAYYKIQIKNVCYGIQTKSEFKKQRELELENSYAIFILVDKKSNQYWISFQFAPLKTNIKVKCLDM